jgi:trans-aconitate methyltransferase
MNTQVWDSERYAKYGRFVSDLGMAVLELLAPQESERILDLGCGDGVLTKRIADLDCRVVGLDSSPELVASARKLGLEVVQKNASEMAFNCEFDAVFSNAALHWMKDADNVIRRVAQALRFNGRFVAEMGGHNCMRTLQCALIEELNCRGYNGEAANPWFFPTIKDYGMRLEAAGFEVQYIALIPRPTPLPDIMGWLTTFCGGFTAVLPTHERADYLASVRERVRPGLCDANGRWTADYVRLRFKAQRSASARPL